MAKFSRTDTMPVKPKGTGPLKTKNITATTYNGGAAYVKGDKTALFTLAVASFLGNEDTFYETGVERDARFIGLVHTVTKKDPEWVARFASWLRTDANIRTAAVMVACEYVKAGGKHGRDVVDSVCQRADEPAEVLGYWLSRYGKKVPAAVKRGVSDAARRLYNERSALKWDSSQASVRMGDVLALTHPKPVAEWQSNLFTYLGDVRHGRQDPRVDGLPVIQGVREWRKAAAAGKLHLDLPDGITWEALSSYTAMDAKAWEAMIPKMGYMALLRNLRNFEEAGISSEARKSVIDRLSDPQEVANSRQLPFRFWSAWKHSDSVRYGGAIEDALEHSLSNVPRFSGRTLVMVDTSESMQSPMSGKSKMKCVEAGALFGAAVASASESGSLWAYGTDTGRVIEKPSVLKTMETIERTDVGYGTNTWPSVLKAWNTDGPFDRILVFTDMQDHPSQVSLPADVPIYVWDLRGYRNADIKTGTNRHLLGGLSDQSFKMISLLEDLNSATWPWEQS